MKFVYFGIRRFMFGIDLKLCSNKKVVKKFNNNKKKTLINFCKTNIDYLTFNINYNNAIVLLPIFL